MVRCSDETEFVARCQRAHSTSAHRGALNTFQSPEKQKSPQFAGFFDETFYLKKRGAFRRGLVFHL